MLQRLLVVIIMMLVAVSVASAVDEGFSELFDGKSLEQWRGYRQKSTPDTWTVVDREIHGGGSGPDLITKQQFGDFELRFEWKVAANGNSGVIYRATEEEPESYQTGLEYQIVDDKTLSADDEDTSLATAAVYALYGADKKDLKPADEYNSSKIVVQGNRIEHWLNDTKVVECVMGSEDWNKKVTASKFSKWPRFAKSPRGHIVLQSHGSPVWFRNVRIKELSAK